MLPKARRLTTKEVQEVLKLGRSRRATYLSMKFLPAAAPLRTSAVVSKAVAKKAVERNRLRRALYRALYLRVGTGRAIVFIQKRPQIPLSIAFSTDLDLLLPSQ